MWTQLGSNIHKFVKSVKKWYSQICEVSDFHKLIFCELIAKWIKSVNQSQLKFYTTIAKGKEIKTQIAIIIIATIIRDDEFCIRCQLLRCGTTTINMCA